METKSPRETQDAHLAEWAYDLSHSSHDATRDTLADTRHELRVMTSLYRGAFRLAADGMVEIERLTRMVAEMREERARIARTVFGPQGASD